MNCHIHLWKTILGALCCIIIQCESSSCSTALLCPCSVPEDILEHIAPDEFQIPEPSIAASWVDEPRQGLHSPGGLHDRRNPDSECTKRSSSSRHSQSRGSVQHSVLALSCSADSGARAAPQAVAGRAMSHRGSEEGGARVPGGSRNSFPAGRASSFLCAKTSGEDVHGRECPTPSSIGWAPPLAHQVTFGEVDLPEVNGGNIAKRRRHQAAYVNKFGPAAPVANTRPVSANPAPCQLSAGMMIDACGVDIPGEVEVRTARYSCTRGTWQFAELALVSCREVHGTYRF